MAETENSGIPEGAIHVEAGGFLTDPDSAPSESPALTKIFKISYYAKSISSHIYPQKAGLLIS